MLLVWLSRWFFRFFWHSHGNWSDLVFWWCCLNSQYSLLLLFLSVLDCLSFESSKTECTIEFVPVMYTSQKFHLLSRRHAVIHIAWYILSSTDREHYSSLWFVIVNGISYTCHSILSNKYNFCFLWFEERNSWFPTAFDRNITSSSSFVLKLAGNLSNGLSLFNFGHHI